MARFAIIDAMRVTNIIEADADFAASIGAIDATGASMGDLWDGTQFSRPPGPPVADLQAAKWEDIKAERDRRTQTGGYFVAPHWYHSDTFSRTQQLGLVLLGANIPAGTLWKTLDNGLIPMTQTLAGQIFGAAANSDIAVFKAAETHKAAMEASADPAAYNFTGGWPAMFEAV